MILLLPNAFIAAADSERVAVVNAERLRQVRKPDAR